MKTLLFVVTLTAYSTSWAGCVSGNCTDGTGTYTSADGSKYVGEFRGYAFHGKGTYTYVNGNKYVGGFLDGKQHGEGTKIYTDGRKEVGVWENDEYFGSKAEWNSKVEKERLAEEKERLAKEEAKKKLDRIYNACLIDKSSGVDMQISSLKKAVEYTCEAIAKDPSWLEEWRYN